MEDNSAEHFTLIKVLSYLVRSQIAGNKNRKYFCDRCVIITIIMIIIIMMMMIILIIITIIIIISRCLLERKTGDSH